MAFELDPKHIGSKVKITGHGNAIEVNKENEELLLSLGQTQFFKYKKNASNNKKSTKPVVHKRKRKSDAS